MILSPVNPRLSLAFRGTGGTYLGKAVVIIRIYPQSLFYFLPGSWHLCSSFSTESSQPHWNLIRRDAPLPHPLSEVKSIGRSSHHYSRARIYKIV
ncbi:hypothetical protein ES703_52603 [subsurface metagenome]